MNVPITRRSVLAGTAAIAGATALPAFARPLQGVAASDQSVERLLASMAEQLLVEYPENATSLGIDKGARAGLKSRLTDRSPAGAARRNAAASARLAQLKAIDERRLSPSTALDLAVVRTAHQVAVDGYRFPYGDVATLNSDLAYRNTPYVVAQNVGAFVEVPDELDSRHTIANRADADAYLTRMEAYAAALDGETARLRHDAGIGVIAPTFLLDLALGQMKAVRSTPVRDWSLVKSIARRTTAIPGNYGARAARIAAQRVAPALDRQFAELTRQRVRARDTAGVWRMPEGEAYYAWALRASTTTRMTPDEVHTLGLELVQSLGAQMDAILRKQGFTHGSVGERMTALSKDPRNLFTNTDSGRAELLAYINGRIADVRTRLPRAFDTLVPARLVVKRVPVEIEAGAPRGYASAGSIDGTVPGTYYINLQDTASWPRYALPTLSYHEGIPGHIWQGEYSYRLPLIRTLLAFNAYSEGWALYAEQLADELGVYGGDPLGRLGYLQSIAFRACRLVVDTGIHAKRWSRDDAIRWFVAANGTPEAAVRSEVNRYCSWPGQACGYEVGHREINRLRGRAKAALGPKYDLRAFDDTVVNGGNVPLDVLAKNVDEYIRTAKA